MVVPAPDCTTEIEPVPFEMAVVVKFNEPALLNVTVLEPADPVVIPATIESVPEVTCVIVRGWLMVIP